MDKRSRVVLNLANSTTSTVRVQLFNTAPAARGTVNSGTTYSWDITYELFTGLTSMTLQVKPVGGSSFETITMAVTDSSQTGVLALLNALGLGTFYIVTSGSSKFIVTQNSRMVFGALQLIYPTNTNQMHFAWQINFNDAFALPYTLVIRNVITTNVIATFTSTQSGNVIITSANLVPFNTMSYRFTFSESHTLTISAFINGVPSGSLGPSVSNTILISAQNYLNNQDLFQAVCDVNP